MRLFLFCFFLLPGLCTISADGWIDLFDGKTLNGWKVGDNAATFSADSGMITVHGNTAHLFYDGDVLQHKFKNFEFRAEVKTMPGANSGIYIHTAFQKGGWPSQGYEIQVNNSHTDWRRTGSLYGIQDVKEVYVKDNEWYTEYIKVQGKKITVKINDRTVVEYTEPANAQARWQPTARALQRHICPAGARPQQYCVLPPYTGKTAGGLMPRFKGFS